MSTNKLHRHFLLDGVTQTESYRPPARGGKRPFVPEQDQNRHGRKLLRQINKLVSAFEKDRVPPPEADHPADVTGGSGYRIRFESFRDVPLIAEKLAQERLGIELLNVRHKKDTNQTVATVFVPTGKLDHFETIIGDYLNKKHDSVGRSRERKPLINAIERIQNVKLRDLWTDDTDIFHTLTKAPIWWEVWLHAPRNQKEILETFRQQIKSLGIKAAPGELMFPERAVLLIRASKKKLQNSLDLLTSIAELRHPKKSADFFENLAFNEDNVWLQNLLSRTRYLGGNAAPHICLLDTGVNRGHQLLEPALNHADMHTVVPAWGKDDADGHGTEMAGLALWGNLTEALNSSDSIEIGHRLESVKLLRQNRPSATRPTLYGVRTAEAVSRPEITDSKRLRIFGMAITTTDSRDCGKPSAWSAKLDSLAADVNENTSHPRLLIVSAGNTKRDSWPEYPNSNDTDGVHDPAQAWNALTVGAYTKLAKIDEPDAYDLLPIAPKGGLSPFSTTSQSWEKSWPFKPDVVFEGGNAALDSQNEPQTISSLSLLTTYYKPTRRSFATTCATSAATALASRFAAQILTEYPKLWRETVRALIVHSAEWTEAMKNCPSLRNISSQKKKYGILLRRCGFGVPNLDQALWTLTNSLTMIIQENLQPFKKERGKSPTLGNIQIHDLPWPRAALEGIGETTVEMRVTLSYFIEPNPSERGYISRHCYQSHGLRFDIKRPGETADEFRKRINLNARSDDEKSPHGGHDKEWLIGSRNRHRGSIHGDIWKGSAADLANRECVAVYPTSGWWKTRPKFKRYNQTARYALIVSIRAPETDVDLYTEVKNQVRTSIKTTV